MIAASAAQPPSKNYPTLSQTFDAMALKFVLTAARVVTEHADFEYFSTSGHAKADKTSLWRRTTFDDSFGAGQLPDEESCALYLFRVFAAPQLVCDNKGAVALQTAFSRFDRHFEEKLDAAWLPRVRPELDAQFQEAFSNLTLALSPGSPAPFEPLIDLFADAKRGVPFLPRNVMSSYFLGRPLPTCAPPRLEAALTKAAALRCMPDLAERDGRRSDVERAVLEHCFAHPLAPEPIRPRDARGATCIVPPLQFQKNLKLQVPELLDMDWSNALLVGEVVLGALLPHFHMKSFSRYTGFPIIRSICHTHTLKESERQLRRQVRDASVRGFNGFPDADAHLLLVCRSREKASEALFKIIRHVQRKRADAKKQPNTLLLRSHDRVTILGNYPNPHIHIYEHFFNTAEEALASVSIDCLAVGFNGRTALASRRSRYSLQTRSNTLRTPCIHFGSKIKFFENLIDVSERTGFAIHLPQIRHGLSIPMGQSNSVLSEIYNNEPNTSRVRLSMVDPVSDAAGFSYLTPFPVLESFSSITLAKVRQRLKLHYIRNSRAFRTKCQLCSVVLGTQPGGARAVLPLVPGGVGMDVYKKWRRNAVGDVRSELIHKDQDLASHSAMAELAWLAEGLCPFDPTAQAHIGVGAYSKIEKSFVSAEFLRSLDQVAPRFAALTPTFARAEKASQLFAQAVRALFSELAEKRHTDPEGTVTRALPPADYGLLEAYFEYSLLYDFDENAQFVEVAERELYASVSRELRAFLFPTANRAAIQLDPALILSEPETFVQSIAFLKSCARVPLAGALERLAREIKPPTGNVIPAAVRKADALIFNYTSCFPADLLGFERRDFLQFMRQCLAVALARDTTAQFGTDLAPAREAPCAQLEQADKLLAVSDLLQRKTRTYGLVHARRRELLERLRNLQTCCARAAELALQPPFYSEKPLGLQNQKYLLDFYPTERTDAIYAALTDAQRIGSEVLRALGPAKDTPEPLDITLRLPCVPPADAYDHLGLNLTASFTRVSPLNRRPNVLLGIMGAPQISSGIMSELFFPRDADVGGMVISVSCDLLSARGKSFAMTITSSSSIFDTLLAQPRPGAAAFPRRLYVVRNPDMPTTVSFIMEIPNEYHVVRLAKYLEGARSLESALSRVEFLLDTLQIYRARYRMETKSTKYILTHLLLLNRGGAMTPVCILPLVTRVISYMNWTNGSVYRYLFQLLSKQLEQQETPYAPKEFIDEFVATIPDDVPPEFFRDAKIHLLLNNPNNEDSYMKTDPQLVMLLTHFREIRGRFASENALALKVDRGSIVASLLRGLRDRGKFALIGRDGTPSKLQPTYDGESGYGSGVYRDVFASFVAALPASPLFEHSRGDTLLLSPSTDPGDCKALGQLFAVFLAFGESINVPIHPVCFAKIQKDVARQVRFGRTRGGAYEFEYADVFEAMEAMKRYNPSVSMTLSKVLCAADDGVRLDSFCLEYFDTRTGRPCVLSSTPDVDDDQDDEVISDARTFIMRYVNHELVHSRLPQLMAFTKGFCRLDFTRLCCDNPSVLDSLRSLTASQFSFIFQRPNTLTPQKFKDLINFEISGDLRASFERYIDEADEKKLSNLLRFVTGATVIPVGGFKRQIRVTEYNKLAASTCGFVLYLFPYPTFAKLRSALNIALATLDMVGMAD